MMSCCDCSSEFCVLIFSALRSPLPPLLLFSCYGFEIFFFLIDDIMDAFFWKFADSLDSCCIFPVRHLRPNIRVTWKEEHENENQNFNRFFVFCPILHSLQILLLSSPSHGVSLLDVFLLVKMELFIIIRFTICLWLCGGEDYTSRRDHMNLNKTRLNQRKYLMSPLREVGKFYRGVDGYDDFTGIKRTIRKGVCNYDP